MKKILVLGAGRSATVLIEYLHAQAALHGWHLQVADQSLELVQAKTAHLAQVESFALDIADPEALRAALVSVSLVISLLPPPLHPQVATVCLEQGCHLLTASYVSPEMAALDKEARQRNLLFMNECGLDPGIDHMSAMEMIDDVREAGGKVTAFHSYCGGLIAPESDTNPWHYKLTWNPRNIVLAGQAGGCYLHEGSRKYIPYGRLFEQTTPVHVEGWGEFEAYVNRDSIHYQDVYGLTHATTLLRGTLRRPGFCRAWNALVQLGLTDDRYWMEGARDLTLRTWLGTFLPPHPPEQVQQTLARYLSLDPNGSEMTCLKWLGLFGEERLGVPSGTPAQLLQGILERRWALAPTDRDMIVMQHQLAYQLDGHRHTKVASLVLTGDDAAQTAMAKTVGLTLGVVAVLLLQERLSQRGVHIPTAREVYQPALRMLASLGICFQEEMQSEPSPGL